MSKTYISSRLKKIIFDRAKNSCEYCLIPQIATFASHQIEHVIAEKHGGLTELHNLALSCTLCNQYKGTDLTSIDPQTGKIVQLFHPRQDIWSEHFTIVNGEIIPKTAKGRVTVKLLQFNNKERIKERKLFILAGIYPNS
ncbi:HNH endonuclease [Geminocystis sp. CENA526]|uniref:HNH endonuclease n=1 Tax=Geminocystis sp. CENA526 TaxID=1355871 RepID=UPI003D6E1632